MRIPSGVTDQYIYFVAVDATDLKTRETGLSSFTVYRSRNGAAAAAMTTPTINETDATNMSGVYELLLDEDMTIGAGNDSEEYCVHITHTGMAPVTRVFELYRSKVTAGETLTVSSGAVSTTTDVTNQVTADVTAISGDTTAADNAESFFDGTGYAGTGNVIPTVTTLTGHTAQTGDNFARLGAPAGASVSADIAAAKADTAAILDDTGTNGVLLAATATSAALVDDVWDEVLTGATHNVASSAGRRLRQLEAGFVIHSGTADAATSNTFDLETGVADTNDDFYNHNLLVTTGGTGAGQVRVIVDYDGTGQQATVAPPWITTPDATTTYDVVIGYAHAETNSKTVTVGLAQAASSSTITLATTAIATDEFYTNDVVMIDAGTGEGQERIITAYNGTTKVATIEPDWIVNPDTTSEYIVEEALCVADIFAISNDSAAADNAEAFFDGTGYAGTGNVIPTVTTLTGHTAQTGDNFAEIGTAGAGLTDLGGMSTAMKAEVNAEVLDVHNVDTITLPGQTAPPLAPTLRQAIGWLYKVFRNRKTQTATQWSLLADDESTVDAKATVSDDGTTAIVQEVETGP